MQNKIQDYILPFKNRLSSVNSESAGLTGYQASYLDHLLSHLEYYLKIYTRCIVAAEEKLKAQRSSLTFLDYGCGNGMLGLFAKFIGYQKVGCCDVDSSSVDATKKLSIATGIVIDHFIHGQIDEVEIFSHENSVCPTVIIGTDVIEHIYDLNIFFRKLYSLNPQQVNVFTTASNPSNPIKVQQLRKLHLRDELKGGYSTHITKFEDQNMPEEAFIVSREKIIAEMKVNLTSDERKQLASLTRGKNKPDIERSVFNYVNTKILPTPDTDKTNTCEPYSGNWSERILSLTKIRKVYNTAGFDLEVRNGFYNDIDAKGLKKICLTLLNAWMKSTGGIGRITAPFIQLTGSKKNK